MIIEWYGNEVVEDKPRYLKREDSFETFIKRCLTNLIDEEYEICFTLEQAKEVCKRWNDKHSKKKVNYSLMEGVYVVKKVHNGRPPRNRKAIVL